MPIFFFHISGCDLAQVSMLCDVWPCVTQYSSSPTGFLSLNHRTADISSCLAHLNIDSTLHLHCVFSPHLSCAFLSSRAFLHPP